MFQHPIARALVPTFASAGTILVTAAALILLVSAPARAADDEPPVWPTVRYGWPEKLSVGLAIQPRLPALRRMVATATIGTGGTKAGLGIGSFGDTLMAGWALQGTILRTWSNPLAAPPHRTYLGVEAQVMLCNISVKIGPAFGVGGRGSDGRDVRLNVSVGFGM